ncbi:MAG: glutamyl-tRNA reductase [Anaerolineae bacterium]
MPLFATGLSHKTAPVALREQLSFTPATLCAFLDRLADLQSIELDNEIRESVILSTCNRLEFYAVVRSPAAARERIVELISQARQIPVAVFCPHLYDLAGEDVVRQALRVASGLDSMVLGEPQILGQVVDAYRMAVAHRTAGTVLSRLFQQAIHTGKRARTETAIGFSSTSISSTAIGLAERHLGDLADQAVMVLGAGEMGEAAIQALMKRRIRKLLIVNRTRAHAEALAARWGATVLTFDALDDGLRETDLVIASTGAPHTVLHPGPVARAMEARNGRALLIIDIALPRDVDPEVGQVPNVHLYNIDHLQSLVTNNLKKRQAEIPRVEAIIAEEAGSFDEWYRSRDVAPTITDLRQRFEAVREQELARLLNRLPGLDAREQEIVATFSRRLLNKFLHPPTVCLKAQAAQGNGVAYTTTLRELFDLETG